MPNPGSYDVTTAHQDREAEVKRLADQASLGWEKEAAVLEGYGFRDGMSILELGSGPGFVTRLLLERDELIAQRANFLGSDPFILFVFLTAGGRKPATA